MLLAVTALGFDMVDKSYHLAIFHMQYLSGYCAAS